MPLLMCPNDNSPMQSLDRNGVQFDMCPTCRGVWPVSYTHLRAHETGRNLVCRLLLEKKK